MRVYLFYSGVTDLTTHTKKHNFIEHFLRQCFKKCHYSTRELALSVQDVIPNNTVSEEVKLGEIAGRVVTDRFASSVNNSVLWDDDLTIGAAFRLFIRLFYSVG